MRLATKTVSYGTLHIAVATGVAYALTGDFTAALGIGLIEPLVQTGVFSIHEKIWESNRLNRFGRACGGEGLSGLLKCGLH